jgi:ATP-binding cassette subfamily F protein 3
LLILSGANLLQLDELINNLDIASVEILENALNDFVVTVLVISHDRYFLDRTEERILDMKDGNVQDYFGGYCDCLEKRSQIIVRFFNAWRVIFTKHFYQAINSY